MKEIKYYEISFGNKINGYPLEEYIYYAEKELEIDKLLIFLTRVAERYDFDIDMTIKEVVAEYIDKFEDEVFVIYEFESSSYGSIPEYYETLESLFLANNFKEGDISRIGYRRTQKGKLNKRRMYTLEDIEDKCFVSKNIISTKKYSFEQGNLLEEENQMKKILI